MKLGELHLGYNSPTPVMGNKHSFVLDSTGRIGIRWLCLQYRFSAFSLHIKGNKISEFVLLHRLMKGGLGVKLLVIIGGENEAVDVDFVFKV